jgi:DNA repair exonuclease SbcCD ATPase subunit
MLNRIEVRNFQSLRKADIPLSRFTVITGPTGSGKSALFRACMLLARNARGTSYITAGEKSCSVAASGSDWAVRISRSNAPRGKNEYSLARLVPTPVPDGKGWSGCKYTKLDGKVPAAVKEALALSEVNFARQFDPPFLLALPPAKIAQALGDLTNVSLVLGAAALAGRKRKQLARDLETACGRRDALLAEAQEFASLKDCLEACTAAEKALARVQVLAARAGWLEALTARLELLETRLRLARAETARQAPPSLKKLDALEARITRLQELAGTLEGAEAGAARCRAAARQAELAEQAAHDAIHAALAAAGQCPTCLQAVA